MKILLVGNGAREHAIAAALKRNRECQLYCFATANNPGIAGLAEDIKIGDPDRVEEVVDYAKHIDPEMAWIGPEAPLEKGLADYLDVIDVSSVGPKKELARIETSKGFARDLLSEYEIPAYPKYEYFGSMKGIKEFLSELDMNVVLKPDGLTGGKGVKVFGDHFRTSSEALDYCREVLEIQGRIVIEEKLVGQEFSLMSFCDGEHIAHMPAVQDNKRAYENDEGPNTGGMGAYSMPDHSMPFLDQADIEAAQEINFKVMRALRAKYGQNYKGVLYGGFMAVGNGVKVIEYNARLGDPEAMNICTLLESDLVEISRGIINGDLDQKEVKFANKASVCKYAVPEGYPDDPVKGKAIDVSGVDQSKVTLYYASVDQTEEGLMLGGSRAVGVVALDDDLYQAEKIVEEQILKIKGPVFHREDIGRKDLIEKRIKMQAELRNS